MALSVVIWGGLVLAFIGLLSLLRPIRFLGIRTRRQAVGMVGMGALFFAAAALVPAKTQRIGEATTLLDEFVPAWQFAERHETVIRASPARVEEAVRAVTAREIDLFLLLTRLRRPKIPEDLPGGDILAPPPDRPILDVALGTSFTMLAEAPAQEVVIGTMVAAPDADEGRRWSPEELRHLTEDGYAKAAMNFHMVAAGDGLTRLVTETKVFATDRSTTRRFAVYWRLIYPGSSLIRSQWLEAIRERAEGGG